MKLAPLIIFSFLLIGCAPLPPASPSNPSIAKGTPRWNSSVARTMREAQADYDAVLQIREPRHARFDKEQALPADGGTRSYLGRGYTLTIQQSLCTVGEIHGVIYGPIIKFSPRIISGNEDTISNTAFYPMEEFLKLKAESEGQRRPR